MGIKFEQLEEFELFSRLSVQLARQEKCRAFSPLRSKLIPKIVKESSKSQHLLQELFDIFFTNSSSIFFRHIFHKFFFQNFLLPILSIERAKFRDDLQSVTVDAMRHDSWKNKVFYVTSLLSSPSPSSCLTPSSSRQFSLELPTFSSDFR